MQEVVWKGRFAKMELNQAFLISSFFVLFPEIFLIPSHTLCICLADEEVLTVCSVHDKIWAALVPALITIQDHNLNNVHIWTSRPDHNPTRFIVPERRSWFGGFSRGNRWSVLTLMVP
jgi:hypothetical protein